MKTNKTNVCNGSDFKIRTFNLALKQNNGCAQQWPYKKVKCFVQPSTTATSCTCERVREKRMIDSHTRGWWDEHVEVNACSEASLSKEQTKMYSHNLEPNQLPWNLHKLKNNNERTTAKKLHSTLAHICINSSELGSEHLTHSCLSGNQLIIWICYFVQCFVSANAKIDRNWRFHLEMLLWLSS